MILTINDKEKIFLRITIIGFAVVFVLNMPIKLSPSFQTLLYNPIFESVVFGVTLIPIVALISWGKTGNQPDRIAMIVAAICVGTLGGIMLWLAPTIGWWTGTIFLPPLIMLAAIYGSMITGFMTMLLALYRWSKKRGLHFAVFIYGLIMLGLIPLAFFGDLWAIKLGLIGFQQGYTIWTDVLYGELILGLPVVIYELIKYGQRKT